MAQEEDAQAQTQEITQKYEGTEEEIEGVPYERNHNFTGTTRADGQRT